MKIKYSNDRFNELLRKDYTDNYIGQGNPDSKILIIGKECTSTDYFFLNNAKIWKEKTSETIDDWFESNWNPESYHPRKPFLGQIMLKDNFTKKHPKTLETSNHGTSNTWKAYQKFINYLLSENKQVAPRQQLNFYDYCFMTELSSNCMPISQKNDATKDSIKRRLGENGILQHSFYKKFPVIIFTIYHYFDWYKDIPIINSFDDEKLGIHYKYDGMIVPKESYNKLKEEDKNKWNASISHHNLHKGEFINVHTAIDNDGMKHILLHTSHLTNRFNSKSDVLFMEMADIIKPYWNQ